MSIPQSAAYNYYERRGKGTYAPSLQSARVIQVLNPLQISYGRRKLSLTIKTMPTFVKRLVGKAIENWHFFRNSQNRHLLRA